MTWRIPWTYLTALTAPPPPPPPPSLWRYPLGTHVYWGRRPDDAQPWVITCRRYTESAQHGYPEYLLWRSETPEAQWAYEPDVEEGTP